MFVYNIIRTNSFGSTQGKTMSKMFGVVLIVVSVICLGLSIYAGWSLREMINDQIIYGSALASDDLRVSLPDPPPHRFVGSGWFGILAPTFLAVMAMLALNGGWLTLTSEEDEGFSDDRYQRED